MISAAISMPKYPGVLPPPPGFTPDIHFKQSGLNLLTQTACIVTTTVFVLLRVYAKHVTATAYHADDYTIGMSVGAWATFIVYCSLCLAMGPFGFGIHMWNVTQENLFEMFRLGYIIEVLNGPVVFLTKLAILMLLTRIFSIKTRFVLYIRMLIAVLTTYYTAITFAKVFVCNPPEKFWNAKVPGRCISYHDVYISDCVVSLITDFVILLAPLPVIWGLQMDLKTQAWEQCRARACIASILRLEVSIRTKNDRDKSYVFLPILLYSCGEIAIGIICGCIPILPSLYRHFYNLRDNRLRWTNTTSVGSGKKGIERHGHRGMVPLQEVPSHVNLATHTQPVKSGDKNELLRRSS